RVTPMRSPAYMARPSMSESWPRSSLVVTSVVSVSIVSIVALNVTVYTDASLQEGPPASWRDPAVLTLRSRGVSAGPYDFNGPLQSCGAGSWGRSGIVGTGAQLADRAGLQPLAMVLAQLLHRAFERRVVAARERRVLQHDAIG